MTAELPRWLDDAETVDATPAPPGPPVDPPKRAATFADVVSRADERRPIVPASLRSQAGRHALLVLSVAMLSHGIAWQVSRTPIYLGRMLRYAPRGAWLSVWRPLRWAAAADDGAHQLKQHAATRLDGETWLRLDDRQTKKARPRWRGLALAVILLVVAVLAARHYAPTWAQMTALIGVFMVFARLGRPSDHPIIEHAFNPNRYVRLTAELTRNALMATDTRIKDPAAVKINKEIYRDGPGYTAEVSLPTGVIATDIIDRRDYLAAGFQLPMPQVWPETVTGAHPGVLAIWVADRPVDRMKQPASPLLSCGPLDFWGQLPYGDDVRMRPVGWRLAGRNSMFAGVPGSGKSWAARNVALGAALDPLVRFTVSELKGSGDFDPLEPLCLPEMYASGADRAAKRQTMQILYWLDGECERRGPLIRKWAKKGLNTENSLNRAIAEADPTLFPLVGIFDELQELITDPELGKAAKGLLVSLVKRGRFAGLHLIVATQRIDRESAPKGLTSNISNRMCLAVPSHTEVDLVLGTAAYNRGARPTTFMPPADGDNPWAGWGYLAGRVQPVRASFVDNPTAESIAVRALRLRGDVPPVDVVRAPDDDLLDDVIRVFAHTNRPGLHWQQLAELLGEFKPQLYGRVTKDTVSVQMRAEGVGSVNVTVEGTTLKGCRRDAVEQVLATRQLAGGGSGSHVSPAAVSGPEPVPDDPLP